MRRCMILSKTIYSWLTRLLTNEVRLTMDDAGTPEALARPW